MYRLLIIKDFRDWFWSTYPDWEQAVSLDTGVIKAYLEQAGFQVEITTFSSFDYRKNYSDFMVIYSSSEDYCGGTKNFMEDILLHLKMQGAILIPDFPYFRAHDNKVMMEILRYGFRNNNLKSIKSQVWASYEEVLKESSSFIYPVVVKKANGAGGEGVFLAHNKRELLKYTEKVSRIVDKKLFDYLSCVNIKQKIIRKSPVKIHNTKFITQNYIENLKGDYKVLVFGDQYFMLHRLNRSNDFRASGSGLFLNDEEDITEILDFARLCKQEISSPWLSLDIGFDGRRCHLIEFQCLFFGFKAMSLSTHHFTLIDDKWIRVEGKVVPEEQFCNGLIKFVMDNEEHK